MAETAKRPLRYIAPDRIIPNPENPRLVFRQAEMDSLLLSIDRHGVQVPITVYENEDGNFVLLDGERRWRCARKLNLKTIPALIQDEPSELDNLVLMYNIHALREQWDYFTTATKLERVVELYGAENGHPPNEIQLSELTGLTRGAIRRCQLLIDLPEEYKSLLRAELDKPKQMQKFSEDFFIEMERSLKTVVNRLPEYGDKLPAIRSTLIDKFRNGTISAVTDFRQLSKIATAIQGLGIQERDARRELNKVFDPNSKSSIRDAFASAVQFEYRERQVGRSVDSVFSFIREIEEEDRVNDIDEDLKLSLRKLHVTLSRILGK